MKFIADECLHVLTKQILIENKFDLVEVPDILNWSVEDEEIFEYAIKNEMGIITHDRRFGQMFIESIDPPTVIRIQVIPKHLEETNKRS